MYLKNRQDGFSLIEVMIALTVFAVFAVVFMTSQGQNIADSSRMRKETMLATLCETKINEIIAAPPELKESLTISKETKRFEKFPNYEYSIEYRRLKLPDISKIVKESEEEEDQNGEIKKRIAKAVTDNMKEMIWQVQVTVTNKETGENYPLSAWVYNDKAKITITP